MKVEDARRIERAEIEIGRKYTFFSTMQQEYEPPEKRIRNYTGKLVTVLSEDDTPGRELADDEAMWLVRAEDGFEFYAINCELNGWICDTGQFFWPDATWGHNHDTTHLANERQGT